MILNDNLEKHEINSLRPTLNTTFPLERHRGSHEIFKSFGGQEVACWPLVPKFAGSKPGEAVGFLRAKKILSTLSFGGEVKPSVPCRRFAACKRSLEVEVEF